MKKIILTLATAVLLLGLSVKPSQAISLPKVTICHNPGIHQETLRIDLSALWSHLHHGDYVGACKPLPTPSPSPEPSESPEPTEEPSASPSATPTETPVPTEEPETVNVPLTPAGWVSPCYGQWAPVIPWAYAVRNGTDATIHYIPTTGVGDNVNVVFGNNTFDAGVSQHGLRDWTPNNGVLQLHNLVLGQGYYFKVQNGCSWWSAIYQIPAK